MEQISVAPFVLKTYEMVSDPSTDALVTWGTANNSFVVLNLFDFSQQLLPKYFKHNNFSSFVRQLNTYGFRKVDSDRWEFANEYFLRGQRHLLKNIIRRRSFQNGSEISGRVNAIMASSTVEMLLASQVERLKHERNSMVVDLAELRQSQMAMEEEVEEMNKRLQVTEKRPQQMMSFLAKVVTNPGILSRMNKGTKQLMDENPTKKQKMIAHAEQKYPPPPSVGDAENGVPLVDENENKNGEGDFEVNSELPCFSNSSDVLSASHNEVGMMSMSAQVAADEKEEEEEEEEGSLLIEDIQPPEYVYECQQLVPKHRLERPTVPLSGRAFIESGF
ncbi:Heat stress transcription factor C-1 [Nymphaea thermarum]|nr:Heat stress transcription factor C-1 [Nymphaea thermarum]